jgi:hypothetical protein
MVNDHVLTTMNSAHPTSRKSLALFCLFIGLMSGPLRAADDAVVRGAEELFWVPTLEQALDMSQATGRPLFLMGYSLVPAGSTYTKLQEDYCTGVF